MIMDIDLTPEPDEVVQSETVYIASGDRPVSVKVCNPVQVRELPAVRVAYQTISAVGTTVGVRLLPFEPRRKSAVIMATDQDVWISSSQSGAQVGASGSAKIPVNVALTIDHLEDVWVCSVTSTTDISVITAYWSE